MTLPRYGRGVLVAGGVGNPPESPLRSVEFLPLVITETSARPRGLPRIRYKRKDLISTVYYVTLIFALSGTIECPI